MLTEDFKRNDRYSQKWQQFDSKPRLLTLLILTGDPLLINLVTMTTRKGLSLISDIKTSANAYFRSQVENNHLVLIGLYQSSL